MPAAGAAGGARWNRRRRARGVGGRGTLCILAIVGHRGVWGGGGVKAPAAIFGIERIATAVERASGSTLGGGQENLGHGERLARAVGEILGAKGILGERVPVRRVAVMLAEHAAILLHPSPVLRGSRKRRVNWRRVWIGGALRKPSVTDEIVEPAASRILAVVVGFSRPRAIRIRWAVIQRNAGRHDRLIVARGERSARIETIGKSLLFGKRPDLGDPGLIEALGNPCPAWKRALGAGEGMHADAPLPHVVFAGRAPCGLAGGLHRGEEQADERRDDRDHHQQFNEGERPSGVW